MSKLYEIAGMLRGIAKSPRAIGFEEELFGLADEIEDAEEELRKQLREIYLAKALKGNDMRTGNPSATWYDAKDPPKPYENVLLWLPDYENARHEGYYTGEQYFCYAWRTICKPEKWRKMVDAPEGFNDE